MGVNSSSRRRGAILVSVLWIMIFLGFLAVILRVQMTGVVAGVRLTEDKASARILAEAGLALVAAEIRAGPPDGVEKVSDRISSEITLQAGVASVSATNEALRIDLNTAERPLIVGALRAAGAAPVAVEELATRIINRRSQPSDGQPQPGSNKRVFQTVSELAAFPGITPDVAIALERYLTVSSGLTGVRLEAHDERLLSAIPNLPSSARSAISQYDAGRISRGQLEGVLAGVSFNTSGQAQTWRFELTTTLQSGYSETFEGLFVVSATEEKPYRVFDWHRATSEFE